MLCHSVKAAAHTSSSVGTEPVAAIRSAMNRRASLLDLQPTIDHAWRAPAGSIASTVQGLRNRTRPTMPATASTTMNNSSPSAINRGIPTKIKNRTTATMTKTTTMPSAMSGAQPGSAMSPRSAVRRRTFRVRSTKRARIVCWPRRRGAHRRRTFQIPAGVVTFTSKSSRIGSAGSYFGPLANRELRSRSRPCRPLWCRRPSGRGRGLRATGVLPARGWSPSSAATRPAIRRDHVCPG